MSATPRLLSLLALGGLFACSGDASRSPLRSVGPAGSMQSPMICSSGECDQDDNAAHAAVVFITMYLPGVGVGSCSGTLASDTIVVTAGHCVSDLSGVLNDNVGYYAVWFGTDCSACVGGTCSCTGRTVTELHRHPDYQHWFNGDGGPLNDVAVLVITGRPTSVTPIPVLPTSLASSVAAGTTVEFSGFGKDNNGIAGVKLHVSAPLSGVCDDAAGCSGDLYSPWTLYYDQQPGGPCFGDSGGPAFVTVGGVEYVAGATSYGDEYCTSFGVSTNLTHFDDPNGDDFLGAWLGGTAFANGHPCAGAASCQSGHCASSVCCDDACDQTCQVCSVAAGAAQDGHCETLGSSACGFCGDGVVGPGEKCDGNCPTSCPVVDPCVASVLQGDAQLCTAECVDTPVTACASGDGCCPSGCDSTTDSDCGGPSCGDGVVDPGETCDGNCPTACPAPPQCFSVKLWGDPQQCNVTCQQTAITTCASGDGCCPAGCVHATDSDCVVAVCGDGIIEPGETCDGDCPTSCAKVDPCVAVHLVGSPSTCDATCEGKVITECKSGDGCCPALCTSASDQDCAPAAPGPDASVAGRPDASAAPARRDAGENSEPPAVPQGCGCSSGPGAFAGWALLWGAWALRRRRAAH